MLVPFEYENRLGHCADALRAGADLGEDTPRL
jgi:hypothetical protein